MIQYYINAAIDILTYALKPKYEPIIDDDTQTAYDLSYGEHPQQVYDFYKGTSNKLFIFLHGGSWWATHRQRDYYRGQFVEPFVNAHPDINVINMDYRLLVEGNEDIHVLPSQIDDVQAVMAIYAEKGYQITLGGNSAGGHLALWYYLNQIEPKPHNVAFITAAYDGTVPMGNTFYFDVGLRPWIKPIFVDPSLGFETMMEVAIYASPSTYANPELDDILAIFATNDAEVPISQMSRMQEDYPDIEYVEYNTWHSGWHAGAFRAQAVEEVYNFITKERAQEVLGAGRYLVHQIPLDNNNNKFGHSNTPFELEAKGSIDGVEFESFKGEVLKGLISDYALKKIDYDFSDFSRAFNIITPETSNGHTFMIIKNNSQRYILTHKGLSSSKYTIPKGATNQDVEFLILRISDTEALFFANTPEDWKYKIYYHVPHANPINLNAANRLFTNIPSLYIFPNAVGSNEYVFRVQGEDGEGNFTEWSTEFTDGTDAFFLPLFDNESTNQYMPELEKINLTSNLFSIVFYPKFEQDLGMIGVQYNNDQEILRSTDLDRVYANTSDEVKPNIDSVLEMHRFNPQSERYQNLLYQLGTEDLDVRSQLEWDAINEIEIPEVEIPEVTIKRESVTEYLVEGVNNEIEANLKFKRLSDGLIQEVNNATLPYTFTHTEDEVWEVSSDGGATYETAWGISLSANAYLEASSVDDLHYNNYMEISFNLGSASSYWQLYGKYTGDNILPKWCVGGQNSKWGTLLYDGTQNLIKREITGVVGQWAIARLITNGNIVTVSDGETEIDYTTSIVMPGTSPLKFRIGRSQSGSAFSGIIQQYKHGTEVFLMNEGAGTTTTGSEGTVLNLLAGASWIKI